MAYAQLIGKYSSEGVSIGCCEIWFLDCEISTLNNGGYKEGMFCFRLWLNVSRILRRY